MKNACEKGYQEQLCTAYAELVDTAINNIDYYIDNISVINNTVKRDFETEREETVGLLINSRNRFDTLL